MGLVKGTIHVDTSYNNGICQSGYIIDIGGNTLTGYSSVFRCDNNNMAEIEGIQKAMEEAILFYHNNHVTHMTETLSFYFIIYNDNITAVSVLDYAYVPSPKSNKKFDRTEEIREWCREMNIIAHCVRKKRGSAVMKKCDKLSKTHRRRYKYSGTE